MEDLDILIGSVDRFLKAEIDPHVDQLDLFPARPATLDIHAKLSEIGILDMEGVDEGFLVPANIVRLLLAMSTHCAGVAAYAAHAIAGEIVRKRFFPSVTSKGLVALGLFEEGDTGFEEGRMDLETLVRASTVSGSKRSVALAPSAEHFLVLSRLEGGLCLAWTDKTKKVKVGAPLGLLGLRALPWADVEFDGARVAAVASIELPEVTYLFALQSLFAAACACGTAAAALGAARAYAAERYQGGKQIEDHDAVGLMQARNDAALQSARVALLAAADEFGHDRPGSWVRCIQAKMIASEAAIQATLDAVQILGGYGYMRDYGIEKRFRDAVSLSLLPADNTRLALLIARAHSPVS